MFLHFCRCCTKSASYGYKNKSATNGAQLVLLIDMTTKFHIDVIKQKFNHSNNISKTVHAMTNISMKHIYKVIYNFQFTLRPLTLDDLLSSIKVTELSIGISKNQL